MRDSKRGVERGQSITFRVPSDTPDHLIKQLQRLKETEKRNFSSRIAQFVLQGVNESLTKERETITVPLPKQLTKEQRNWMKHEHSEALIGSILYQLMKDPVRATTLLASLNSNAYDIDEALYLQEEVKASPFYSQQETEQGFTSKDHHLNETEEKNWKDLDEGLDDLNVDSLMDELHSTQAEEEEEQEENPLDDFFSSMNK